MGLSVFSWGTEPFDPSHRFVTSWLFGPWILFVLRALLSLYAFATTFFSIGWLCQHPRLGGCDAAQSEFSFFTVITFWGLAFYFLVSAVHTCTYARSGRALLDSFPRPLQALHSLFYTTICVFPFIVTVVYWGILFSGRLDTSFGWWSNISRHAMNTGFALIEVVFTRTGLPPWIHILWLVVILILYLALAYVTHATRGFYVYPFLDPSKGPGPLAGYICGIAVACVIFFLLIRGLIWLRTWVTETKLGMAGKFSPRDGATNSTGDPEFVQKNEQSH